MFTKNTTKHNTVLKPVLVLARTIQYSSTVKLHYGCTKQLVKISLKPNTI